MKRAFVVRGGALGDFILTLPVLRALRARFDQVNVLANRRFGELMPHTPLALDDPQLAPFFTATDELPRKAREFFADHDVVVSYLHDPEQHFERNVRACGVERFVRGQHRMKHGVHATEQLASALHQLRMAVDDFTPRLELSDEEVADVRGDFPLPLTVLHPGSGSARKNWPIENWVGLLDALLARGECIVVAGGEADERELGVLRERFAGRIRLASNWPLVRLGALLHRARFIGHDSGISHLAAAAGARCVVLFGPTDPKVWAVRGENVRLLFAPGGDLRQLRVAEVLCALPPSS